jgi:hypothetical protein
MKTLLVYPPFCTPASPPYSITNIHAFLKNNLPAEHQIEATDLNLEFHKLKFKDYQQYCKTLKTNYNREEYEKTTNEYQQQTKTVYSHNNSEVVKGNNPELIEKLLKKITDQQPDLVAFSIVYSSQAFYAYALIKELNKLNIKTVIGGPAINQKLISISTPLKHEIELLEYITQTKSEHNTLNFKTIADFSIYPLDDYFTPEPVIPIRTSTACYYKQCAFCSHHNNENYFEYDIENIKESIIKSKAKHVFIVDDMINKKRILKLAEAFKPLNISWMCQLRPTKDLDKETLTIARESGLKFILWGVESANNRVLDLIKKGTNKDDIQTVLKDSKEAGINNVLFIMFGFPSETEEEFKETIHFLEENRQNIDLISTSVFGLQTGTPIYNTLTTDPEQMTETKIIPKPNEFHITEVNLEKRTILEPKISYKLDQGISQEQATDLRKRHIKLLDTINRYPRSMNFFREHLLCQQPEK